MGVFGDGQLAGGGRAQDVTVPGRHREPTFCIQTERRSPLKHDRTPHFEKTDKSEAFKWHFSPLNCTFLHCISKPGACKRLATKISNEIKDLALILKARRS
jgi:hypothetical protein